MSGETVLIVEDEWIIAREMASRLQGLGCAVLGIAESGSQAMAVMEVAAPDLVLLDIGLKGGRDGIDLAAEISRRWAIPVVYVTGLSDEETLRRARMTHPYGYLVKPFSGEAFRESVELALFRNAADVRPRMDEVGDPSIADDVDDPLD